MTTSRSERPAASLIPPRLVLFGTRRSPFVEKVARGLEYKGLAFQLVEPTSPFEFARWNPVTRKMPVLEIDGERVGDSTFILREIERRVSEPALLSSISIVAAAQRQLEDWADESLYWLILAIRAHPENLPAAARQMVASLAPAWRALGTPVARQMLRRAVEAQGMGRLPVDILLAELSARLDDLVTLLDDRPWFYSRQFGMADLAVYAQLRFLASGPTPEAAALLAERPALVDFVQRVGAVGT